MDEIRIQDFILKTNDETTEKNKTAEKSKKKKNVEYSIAYSNETDFIVKRQTSRTSKLMVIIGSQNQKYIKDEATDKIEILTADLYASFMQDLPSDGLNTENCQWIDAIYRGKVFGEKLINILENEFLMELMKNGMLSLTGESVYRSHSMYSNFENRNAKALTPYMKLYKKLFAKLEEKQNISKDVFIKEMTKIGTRGVSAANIELANIIGRILWAIYFKEDNLRNFINTYGKGGLNDFTDEVIDHLSVEYENAVSGETYYSWYDRRLNIDFIFAYEFKLKNLTNYLIHQPEVQGYAIRDFCNIWSDTLRMERDIFGKIPNKYPKNLASYHQKLSSELRLIRHLEEETIKEENRKKSLARYETLLPNKLETEKYTVKPAISPDEILEVAKLHSNCLASYTEKYANGGTDLYFMVNKKNNEVTTTIEIKNNSLRQAYDENNTKPSKEEMGVIEKFCNKNNFEFNNDYQPMGVDM